MSTMSIIILIRLRLLAFDVGDKFPVSTLMLWPVVSAALLVLNEVLLTLLLLVFYFSFFCFFDNLSVKLKSE